ncbi:SICAvar - type I, partial [Plasmodium knowlesi]
KDYLGVRKDYLGVRKECLGVMKDYLGVRKDYLEGGGRKGKQHTYTQHNLIIFFFSFTAQVCIKDAVDDPGKVWEQVPEQLKALAEATKEEKRKEVETMKFCSGLNEKGGKDACILIAAGLKNLYDIKEDKANGNDPVTASFQRTMQCVLLNAIADKLENKDFPCKDEKKTKEGIDHAFGESEKIMKIGAGCKGDNVTCFKCERVTLEELKDCNLDSKSTTQNLKYTITIHFLLHFSFSFLPPLKKKKKKKKFCTGKPCYMCVCICIYACEQIYIYIYIYIYFSFYFVQNRMESDFRTQLTNLLSGMQDQRKQDPDAKYCNHDTNNQKWDESDAHDAANKTACKLVAAGLQHISSIQGSYSVSEKTPYDNQEFKQFVSCLMLRAVAQQMKEKSIICNIQPGIDAAFAKAGAIKKDHCTNNKPCIVCTLDDRTKDELNDCTIPNGKGPHVNVKPKLESLLTGEESNVNKTIQDLLKTDKS